jgi:hypothetical protein
MLPNSMITRTSLPRYALQRLLSICRKAWARLGAYAIRNRT